MTPRNQCARELIARFGLTEEQALRALDAIEDGLRAKFAHWELRFNSGTVSNLAFLARDYFLAGEYEEAVRRGVVPETADRMEVVR
jgi:hypothetical protein